MAENKRRNYLLQAISPFSHNVFHSYISLMRQNAALCGNGLMTAQTLLGEEKMASTSFLP